MVRVVRSIDERISDLEAKVRELKAKKEGGSSMGSQAEAKAYQKLIRTEKGFGLTYAQMAGILKQISVRLASDTEEGRAKRLHDFAVAGQELLAPYLPAAGTEPASEPAPDPSE